MSGRAAIPARLAPLFASALLASALVGLPAPETQAAGPDAGAAKASARDAGLDGGAGKSAVETSSVTEALDEAEAAREAAEKKRLEALAREYEDLETGGLEGGRPERSPTSEGRSFLSTLVQMMFVLGGVVLLAYLVLGRLLPRFFGVEPQLAERRIMRVIDRMPLDQRRSILVIRVGNHDFLVGASEGGIHLLSRLDPTDVDEALATARATTRPTLGGLAARLAKKKS